MKRMICTSLMVFIFALISSVAGPADAQQKPLYSFKLQSMYGASDYQHQAPIKFAEVAAALSGGRIKVDVKSAGAIVGGAEILEAVSNGIVDMGYSWPGFWFGKHPAATLFASMGGGPFGMDSQDFLGWYNFAGGKEFYQRLLQKELKMNVVVFCAGGETNEPMGWFKKRIKTLADLKGVKFRAAGMSSEVFKALGMSVVIIQPGEIVPALQRGVIDGSEYSDPACDMTLGLQDVAKFYYLPGMHQPSGMMEILVNKSSYDKLPEDIKAIIEYSANAAQNWWDIAVKIESAKSLKILVDKHHVNVIETPREFMLAILNAWDKVAEKHCKENAFFNEIYQSQKQYAKAIVPFKKLNEAPYDLTHEYYWSKENPYKAQKP
jgi:TRAP-type mannitol/chloroaromatic compound transport system substrate-binding protein